MLRYGSRTGLEISRNIFRRFTVVHIKWIKALQLETARSSSTKSSWQCSGDVPAYWTQAHQLTSSTFETRGNSSEATILHYRSRTAGTLFFFCLFDTFLGVCADAVFGCPFMNDLVPMANVYSGTMKKKTSCIVPMYGEIYVGIASIGIGC